MRKAHIDAYPCLSVCIESNKQNHRSRLVALPPHKQLSVRALLSDFAADRGSTFKRDAAAVSRVMFVSFSFSSVLFGV
jgi:hypothetical protein